MMQPTDFDKVSWHVQQALDVLRDVPRGDLVAEQVRTAIYTHLCDAASTIAYYAFVDATGHRKFKSY